MEKIKKNYILNPGEADFVEYYDDDREPFEIMEDCIDAWKDQGYPDYKITNKYEENGIYYMYIIYKDDEADEWDEDNGEWWKITEWKDGIDKYDVIDLLV